MSFAEEILGRLFPKEHKNQINIDKGTLKRSESELSVYQEWIASDLGHVLKEVARNLHLSKLDLRDDLQTIWYSSTSANGFYFETESLKEIMPHEWFLLDYLKDKTIALGYRTYQSSFEHIDENGRLAYIERHYLKPPIEWFENHQGLQFQNQRYGNILIELISGEKKKIKLLNTVYSGRNFTHPKPFKELLSNLFPDLKS